MRAMVSLRNLLLLSSLTAVAITCAGCPANNSVLAGDWALTVTNNPNPALTNIILSFDNRGDLTSFSYVLNGLQITRNVPDLSSTTTVNGSTVTVTLSYAGGSQLTFSGTLNAANTVVTGTVQYSLTVGNTTISAPTGTPATLTLDP